MAQLTIGGICGRLPCEGGLSGGMSRSSIGSAALYAEGEVVEERTQAAAAYWRTQSGILEENNGEGWEI